MNGFWYNLIKKEFVLFYSFSKIKYIIPKNTPKSLQITTKQLISQQLVDQQRFCKHNLVIDSRGLNRHNLKSKLNLQTENLWFLLSISIAVHAITVFFLFCLPSATFWLTSFFFQKTFSSRQELGTQNIYIYFFQ